jgi:hypothetical protein
MKKLLLLLFCLPLLLVLSAVGQEPVPDSLPVPIVKAAHPPAIDGVLDDIWENAPWQRNFVYPSGATTFNDAALSWRAMWDNDYLYVFVNVVDDIFLADDRAAGWHGDSVEMWLDGDNSKGGTYDGINDLGYTYFYSNDPEDPIIFHPSGGVAGEWHMNTTGHKVASAWSDMGVNLEYAIPMKNLGANPPLPGQLMGFDVDYNDNDEANNARETKVKWFDITDYSWTNPSLMGTIELVDRVVNDITEVPWINTPPVIDGVEDASFADVPWHTLNHYLASADSLHSWNKDLRMDFKTAWDSTYLYYFIKVADDTLMTAGVHTWTDDGIEIWFDGDNSKKKTYDGINDFGFQFPYMEGAGLDSMYFFNATAFDPAAFLHATQLTQDGMTLEIAIPIDSVGMKPTNGWKFGIEIDYNDSDTFGVDRDTKCKTYATVDNTWTDPSLLGTSVLVGGPGETLPPAPQPLLIDMTANAPLIDGVMDVQWENARNYQIANLVTDPNFVVDNWKDSYGNFRVLYDAKNLYVFVQVNDDTIVTSAANTYERDCVEIYWDGDNSKNPVGADPWAWPPTAYDANDSQSRFVFDTAPENSEGVFDISSCDYVYLQTDNGWNLEFSVPWKGQPFKGTAGLTVGFEININDADGGANAREAITKWWATTDEAWHNPSVFGTAQFTGRTINEKKETRLLPVPFTAYPVNIDAQEDYGWKDIPPVFGNYRFNGGELVNVDSPKDLELQWRAMWDYENLYLLIDVKDDTLVRDSGTAAWNDDGIEFWIDGNASRLPTYTDANDLGFNWRYNPEGLLDPVGDSKAKLTVEQMALIKDAKIRTEDGIVLEASIPWSIIGTSVGNGAAIAMECDWNDDDNGGDRDTKLKCYDPTDNSWQYPYLLGLARLTGSVLISDVKKLDPAAITTYELQQNYPNPFNPSTNIEFALPKSGQVSLIIFDVLGREVGTLLDKRMEMGRYSINFNAARLASGVYFYKLQTSDYTETKKMMFIK